MKKLAVVGAVLALALAGCSSSSGEAASSADGAASAGQSTDTSAPSAAGELQTIRLGVSPFQDTMLPLVGVEKGWFEEAGLDVQLESLAWDSVMPAVATGSVDAAINNTTGVVSVAGKAPNVVYWYAWNPFTQGSALMGNPESGIKTVEELEASGLSHDDARTQAIEGLKGRTIVTTLSTDMGKQAIAALESVGLTTDDVTIIDMNPDQGLAAFLSGTGDAYLGGIPQRTRAATEGMVVVASGPDLAAPPINGLVTTTDYVDGNEDALLRLVNVFHRIIRYCDAETEACGQIITEQLNKDTGANLSVQGFKDFWQNFELYAPNAAAVNEMILDPSGVAYWQRTWDGDNEYLMGSGAITEPVAADDHFLVQGTWDKYVEKFGADESGY